MGRLGGRECRVKLTYSEILLMEAKSKKKKKIVVINWMVNGLCNKTSFSYIFVFLFFNFPLFIYICIYFFFSKFFYILSLHVFVFNFPDWLSTRASIQLRKIIGFFIYKNQHIQPFGFTHSSINIIDECICI